MKNFDKSGGFCRSQKEGYYEMEKKAYLVLENGDVYEGYSFGAEKKQSGSWFSQRR